MHAALFLVLVGVYLVGILGIVVAGSIVGEEPGLEDRLARIRAAVPARRTRKALPATEYFVRVVRRN